MKAEEKEKPVAVPVEEKLPCVVSEAMQWVSSPGASPRPLLMDLVLVLQKRLSFNGMGLAGVMLSPGAGALLFLLQLTPFPAQPCSMKASQSTADSSDRSRCAL